MTSIATSADASIFNLQTQAQPQGQMFESLKKQLEDRSFDRLFQDAGVDQVQDPTVPEHTMPVNQGAEQQVYKTNLSSDVVFKALNNDQTLGQVQLPRLPGSNTSLRLVQTKELGGDLLMGLQISGRFSGAFGGLDGESTVRTTEAHALMQITSAPDIASQAMVVGIEGERVRVWMRSHSTTLRQDQLISRIRAELSWAGMALESFVLNGRKLVGIK